VASQTIPAPVSEERVLEQLEAEFLLSPDPWLSPQELDLAETLAPAIGRVHADPACRVTRIMTRRGCCD
jgi:hypothetical protein